MNKILKRILITVITVIMGIMCISLCACNKVDADKELKVNHAYKIVLDTSGNYYYTDCSYYIDSNGMVHFTGYHQNSNSVANIIAAGNRVIIFEERTESLACPRCHSTNHTRIDNRNYKCNSCNTYFMIDINP